LGGFNLEYRITIIFSKTQSTIFLGNDQSIEIEAKGDNKDQVLEDVYDLVSRMSMQKLEDKQ